MAYKNLFAFLVVFLLSAIAVGQIERSVRFILADFKGGKSEFKHWLHLEMQYPKEALEKKQKGKVVFVVEVNTQGKGTIVRQDFSGGALLDKEATRLVNMIEWVPATYEGKPEISTRNVTVNFAPKKYYHYVKQRGYDTLPTLPIPVDTTLKVYNITEVTKKPQAILPPNTSFNEYVYSELKFPPQAYKLNITGVTHISFVVEPSGNITNVYPQKYLGGGCFEEAVRVLRTLKWQPAEVNGMVVRSYYNCTISFTMNNNQQILVNPAGTNNSMH